MARLLAVLAVAVLAGACAGGDDGSYDVAQLEEMVLRADDLEGRGWTRFAWGRQVRADQPSGARSDPARHGRLDGWKARYRRPGSSRTPGPLVVESRADVFADAAGATADFDDYGAELETAGTALEEVDDLGDRGIVATLVRDDVRFFLVMWRDANAVAALNLNGFEGRLTRDDALALARKQQDRMRGS